MSAGGDLLLGQEDVPRLKATVMSGRISQQRRLLSGSLSLPLTLNPIQSLTLTPT